MCNKIRGKDSLKKSDTKLNSDNSVHYKTSEIKPCLHLLGARGYFMHPAYSEMRGALTEQTWAE